MSDPNITLARLEHNERIAARERKRQATLATRDTLPAVEDQSIEELFDNWGANVARIAMEHIENAHKALAGVSG